jgi:hypothetical protein
MVEINCHIAIEPENKNKHMEREQNIREPVIGSFFLRFITSKHFFYTIFERISLHKFVEMRFFFEQSFYAEDERIIIS